MGRSRTEFDRRRIHPGIVFLSVLALTVGGLLWVNATRQKNAKADAESARNSELPDELQDLLWAVGGQNPGAMDELRRHRDELMSRVESCEQSSDYASAQPLLQQLVEISQRVFGDDDEETIASINNLGQNLLIQEKYEQAEPLIRNILQTSRRVLGTHHPLTAIVTSNMACVFEETGRYDEAEPLHRDAFEIASHALGSDHSRTRSFESAMYRVAILKQDRHEDYLVNYVRNLVVEYYGVDELKFLSNRPTVTLNRQMIGNNELPEFRDDPDAPDVLPDFSKATDVAYWVRRDKFRDEQGHARVVGIVWKENARRIFYAVLPGQ